MRFVTTVCYHLTTHNCIIINIKLQAKPEIEIVTENRHGRSGSRKNKLYYIIGARATTLQLYYRCVQSSVYYCIKIKPVENA